jgi:RNA polymerase sigma-70 factor (ECF subfamily)
MSEQPPERTTAVTDWLLELGRKDKPGLDEMFPAVYDELHRLAVQYLSGEGVGHTLQPTALVHEAYLHLVDQRRVDWRNRAQFLGIAARMMRRILVDHARNRRALKRGGVQQLTALDPRKAQVVELKFFGGLSGREIAEVLQISDATVEREWTFARAWLYKAIEGVSEDPRS